jgi:release factor glutamine methyltransferase
VARRAGGVPLEQLLGWACFDGLRVVVTPGVFVPRRRSELLVEVVAGLPATRVLDLCCGSGAIGAAVAARVRRGGGEAEVWAADVDPVAVACARQNLPPDRVLEGDLYDALPVDLRGSFDVVAVNAPYVPTDAIATMPPEARDHEPRAALDGGTDGVDLHRRVAAGARDWLRPGGTLVVETSRHQAPLTLAALADAGLAGRVVTDDERDATAVVGTAP